MKRAVYRSVWFWLGCFVLGFLVWVWVDSWKTETHAYQGWVVGKDTGGGGFMPYIAFIDGVTVDDGTVIFNWGRVVKGGPEVQVHPTMRHFKRGRSEFNQEEWPDEIMGSDRMETVNGSILTRYHVNVAMWVVVGCYVLLGGGVLVWRWRRSKRVLLDGGGSV